MQVDLPSMQVNSWATILLSMSLEATSLLGVMASISSMNRIHGLELCKEENAISRVSLHQFYNRNICFMKHVK